MPFVYQDHEIHDIFDVIIEMVVEAQAPVLLVSVFGRIFSGAFATVNHFEYFKFELMPETNTIVCAKKQKTQKYWN